MAKNVLLITARSISRRLSPGRWAGYVKPPSGGTGQQRRLVPATPLCRATPCSPAQASFPGYAGWIRMWSAIARRWIAATTIWPVWSAAMAMTRCCSAIPIRPATRARPPATTLGWRPSGGAAGLSRRCSRRRHAGRGRPAWRDWLVGRGVAVPAKLEDLFFPTRRFTLIPAHGRLSTRRVFGAAETETPGSTVFSPIWRRWRSQFAHMSFLRPHPPFCVPAPCNGLFNPADMPAPTRRPSVHDESRQHPTSSRWRCWSQSSTSTRRTTSRRLPRPGRRGAFAGVDVRHGRPARRANLPPDRRVAALAPMTTPYLYRAHGEMLGDHCPCRKSGYFDGAAQWVFVTRRRLLSLSLVLAWSVYLGHPLQQLASPTPVAPR